ncbi:MAG: acyl-CoA thioesterase [Thermoplasmata archaeon]|jgi:acyl-CoA thioester hydrolase
MSFKYKYRISWVDTDALGVMHFSNFFRICERTEEEFRIFYKLNTPGISFPRVHAECNYKYPLRFLEIAEITMDIKEIGKKHIKMEFQIFNETKNRLSAFGNIVIVAINDKFEPIEIPDWYINKIKEIMEKF